MWFCSIICCPQKRRNPMFDFSSPNFTLRPYSRRMEMEALSLKRE